MIRPRYTPYQSGYLAHLLTLEGASDQALTQAIAGAKVDLNPHQVEAALFALASPLSKGVLLADEVGLGKTIEASLVLAQKWAEGQRKLLLIVPATLRKQWTQELTDKFSLPATILEARNFNQAIRDGHANPFDVERSFEVAAIVICSYEFASRQEQYLSLVPWDLVVFDEAHKLRNIYKSDGAKIAKRLEAALTGRTKILLSATPLQNNLQELYGLISVIDPYFFGGLDAFKARYSNGQLAKGEFVQLRARLKTVCMRTLRRQVQEQGGIRFTRRYSLTEDFTPSAEELQLYADVSTYLQQDDLLAIKQRARHLVTLVIRKILASSSRAITGTLDTMIARLEGQLPLTEEQLGDYDAIDDLSDAYEVEETTDAEPFDPIALQAEITQLKDFRKLAASITQDRKAEALLRVLGKAFDMTERLGGARKAVIFTESVRTQTWLFETLDDIPTYKGRVVLLNGNNADASSKSIYQKWVTRHQGTARVSNSRSADMKAALVDAFRDDANIMICTEAGAEGINLQFCSLLINYDLPWNPQRVEQRIGRVHRYGQKHDVVVVNFINQKNLADRRVFELLSLKFQLFEGVFGASDEILGSIESGIDIEQRIHKIYQHCRNDAEIDAEFNALNEKFKVELDARARETERSVLDNLDADVVRRLNMRSEKTSENLSRYQERLLLLARMMLPQATFEEHRFLHNGVWHNVNWQVAEATDEEFFRPNEGSGHRLIEQAKSDLALAGSAEVVFCYESIEQGQYSDLRRFIGSSGHFSVDKLSMKTARQLREHLLLAARTDAGDLLDAKACERLLFMPAEVVDANDITPEPALLAQLDSCERAAVIEAERENARYYEAETEKLDRWAEDRRIALDIKIKQLDGAIKDARKALRQFVSLQDKLDAKRDLQGLERERDEAMLAYHEEKKKIEAEEDRLLEEVEQTLHMETQRERLFLLRWHLKEIT
jgi:ERCC4-related helicase